MKSKIISILIVFSMLFSGIIAISEEDLDSLYQENEDLEEAASEVLELSLRDTVRLVLENNLDKRVAEKQMNLQDIQLDIAGDANAELRRLERDMRSFADQLSSNVIDIQREIDYVKSLDYTTTIEVDNEVYEVDIIDTHYDHLMERRISKQFLTGINNEFSGSGFYSLIPPEIRDELPQELETEPARALPPEVLIEAMEDAKSQAGEAFFEIHLGTNEAVRQANSMAASILGLQATRRLDMEDAVNIIRTKTNQAAQLLIRSDIDVTEGFKLLAESSFYGLVQANKTLEVQEKAYLRAKEQYQNAYHTYSQGLMSSSDLQLVMLQYNGSKISLRGAEIERNKALIDLNQALGLPYHTEVKLIEPEYQELDFSLEDAFEIAYFHRTDMFTARQDLELAEKNIEYVDKKHRDTTKEYQESLAYYELKEIEYENIWYTAKSTIHKSYLDWQNAEYAYELSLENLEIIKKQLEIAEVAYELGFSSNSGSPMANLLQAQEQLASLEQALASAEFGRNLALQNYLREIGYAHYLREKE